jgi:HEAT repeat protein/beta-lactamase regulating signal transducer with metallopeptidase domain
MNLIDAIDQTLCARVLLALGHSLWVGAAIGALCAIVLLTLRKSARAGARYGVLLCAMSALVASPVASFVWLGQNGGVVQTASTVQTGTAALSEGEAVGTNTDAPGRDSAVEPQGPAPESDVSRAIEGVAAADREEDQASAIGTTEAATPGVKTDYLSPVARGAAVRLAVLLYVLIAAALLARLLVGIAGGGTLRRRSESVADGKILGAVARHARAIGLQLAPAIAYCGRVTVPTVVGIVRPMILLPLSAATGMTPEQVEYLVLHELAHIRRYDHIVNLVQRVIEALLFYHPVVWILSRQIRIEREHCCDDLVVRLGGDAHHYAESLLMAATLARGLSTRAAVPSLGATGKPSHLRHRIARILGEPAPAVRLRHTGWIVAVFFIFVSVVTIAQLGNADKSAAGGSLTNFAEPVSVKVKDSGTPDEKPTIAQADVSAENSQTKTKPGQAFVGEVKEPEPEAGRTDAPESSVKTPPNDAFNWDSFKTELVESAKQIPGISTAESVPLNKSIEIRMFLKPGVEIEEVESAVAELNQKAFERLQRDAPDRLNGATYADADPVRFYFARTYSRSIKDPNATTVEPEEADSLYVQLQDKDWWLRKLAIQQLAESGAPEVWTNIVPLLKDEDKRVQAAAAVALGHLKEPKSIKHLVAALKEGDDTADAAAKALGQFDPAQVMPLVRLAANDEDIGVQCGAIKALGEVKSPEVVDVLLGVLGRISLLGERNSGLVVRPVPRLRSQPTVFFVDPLSDVIARILPAIDPQVLQEVIQRASKHSEWRVRAGLMKALARPVFGSSTQENPEVTPTIAVLLNRSEVIQAQISALSDEQKDVRAWAAMGLGKSYFLVTDNPELIETRRNALIQGLRDSNLQIAGLCGEYLQVQFGGASWKPSNGEEAVAFMIATQNVDGLATLGQKAIPALVTAANADRSFPLSEKQGNFADRNFIAQALAKIGGRDVVEPLIDMLNSADDDTVVSICVALGDIGDPRGVEPLIRTVSNADQHTQYAAVQSLGKLKDKRAFEALTMALNSPEPSIRRDAAGGLGSIGDTRATPVLLALMEKDPEYEVRAVAASSLGDLGDPAAVPTLAAVLSKDGRSNVRFRAAGALGKLGGAQARDALLTALRSDSEGDVRKAAAEALGKIKDPAAIAPLSDAVRFDNEAGVEAVKAIALIGTPEAIQSLKGLLSDALNNPGPYNKAAATVAALGDNGTPAALEVLYGLLRDDQLPDPKMQLQAALALADKEDPRATEFLNKLRGNANTRIESERALTDLQGQPPAQPAQPTSTEANPPTAEPSAGEKTEQPLLQFRLVVEGPEAEGKTRVVAPIETEPDRTFALADEIWLSEKDMSKAVVRSNDQTGKPNVVFGLKPEAGERLKKLTGDNIGKMIAIVYKEKLLSAPVINDAIGTSGVISGNLTQEEAEEIAALINGAAAATESAPSDAKPIAEIGGEQPLPERFLYDAGYVAR